ncbi:MAG TPA: alpha/beta fold hydrolase [Magnetospirillaceae bacterium]|nr:alpha/beta fold hydrolase [Magnetospirillaceae bacterium]
MANIEHLWTEDGLRLMGIHYSGRDTCVLEIHGMSGNFIENYYVHILGEKLAAAGYGFIYGHNRGYCHINGIPTKPMRSDNNGYNSTRLGAMYELFEDCPKDISAWISKAKELGYKKIILLGHSLGCNKVVYYLHNHSDADIVGVILASPPDMVGLIELKRYQPNHRELVEEARKLVAAGKPRQLLSGDIWGGEYILSAQTYLGLFEEGGPADNLSVNRNPETFNQLATIKQPILGIMGEHDDIEIRDLRDDIQLIKSKATSCEDFRVEFVSGANHDYQNREEEFADIVLSWLKNGINI